MLRTNDYVMGLPSLADHDAAKVQLGNNILRFCCRLFRACHLARVPFALENPWTSWAWSTPAARSIMKLPGARFARTDFCCWRMPWRKSTGFLAIHCDTGPIERQCKGRCICSESHMPHVQLAGAFQGIF